MRGAADLGLGGPAPGRSGHNDEEGRLVPVRVEVEGLRGSKIVSATCGDVHSAAVTRGRRPLHPSRRPRRPAPATPDP